MNILILFFTLVTSQAFAQADIQFKGCEDPYQNLKAGFDILPNFVFETNQASRNMIEFSAKSDTYENQGHISATFRLITHDERKHSCDLESFQINFESELYDYQMNFTQDSCLKLIYDESDDLSWLTHVSDSVSEEQQEGIRQEALLNCRLATDYHTSRSPSPSHIEMEPYSGYLEYVHSRPDNCTLFHCVRKKRTGLMRYIFGE